MTDNLPVLHSYSFAEMERLAKSIAASRMFGIQTVDQALTLMALSQAEGRHPALCVRDFDIIQGKPAKKAEAMQRDFLGAGGKIEWHALSDDQADATFSHPQGGSVRIVWDHDRARKAGLGGKDNWKKYPRQMLRARAVSEGVRTVFPAATSGLLETGEAHDIGREMVDVTPPAAESLEARLKDQLNQHNVPHDPETGEIVDDDRPLVVLKEQGDRHAALGSDDLKAWYMGLDRAEKRTIKPYLDETLKQRAIVADNMALESGATPEQPAGANMSGDSEPPPAEPLPYEEDAFGLPPLSEPGINDDPVALARAVWQDEQKQRNAKPFIDEMLTVARTFTSHEQFDEMKTALGDGRTTRGRVAAKLPQDTYWALVRQIGEIEEKLNG